MQPKHLYLPNWIHRSFILFTFLSCLLSFHSLISFAISSPSPSKELTTVVTSDESAILREREAAIQNAVELLNQSKRSGSKGVASKRIQLGEKRDNQMQSKSVWQKLFFWKKDENDKERKAKTNPVKNSEKEILRVGEKPKTENRTSQKNLLKSFFSRPEKSPNWETVVKKRKERAEEFPGLDPEQIKESITNVKIELKREFLSAHEHNLDDVVGRAIQVHLPAQIAHEKILLSERRIVKAFRDFFSDAEFAHTFKDGTLTSGPYKHRSWRVALRQPIFKGGVLWNTYRLEMENRETAKRELEKIVSDVVAQASGAYFEYERAWNVLQEKERVFEEAKSAKNLSDEKAKANLISEIEKLNIDSLYGQVDYDLQTAKQDFELAKLELQKVLELDLSDPIEIKLIFQAEHLETMGISTADVPDGTQGGKKIKPEASGLPLAISGQELERLVDLAYVHRSDLQVEASKLHAARLTHKISVGKLLPEAELIVEFGKLGEAILGPNRRFVGDLETTKPPLHNEWRIGAEMTWKAMGNTLQYSFDHDQRAPSLSQFQGTGSFAEGPISASHTATGSLFDSLNSLADLKETKIAVLEQVVQLEKTERDVIKEVKEAYFNYNKALIQSESSYKRVKYRERLKTLAKHRLDNNEIQLSEYLQSEIDYEEERAKLYKALADFYTAKANLNRAVGIRDYLRMES